jgi:pyruvate kinase
MKSSNFICSIGHCNNSVENIERFLYGGMSCVRLDMCYGSIEDHKKSMENFKLAKENYFLKTTFQATAGVAIDIQGPAIKVWKIKN